MGVGDVGDTLGLLKAPYLIDALAALQVNDLQRVVLKGSYEKPPVRGVHREVVDPAMDPGKRYRLDPSQRRGLLSLSPAPEEHVR